MLNISCSALDYLMKIPGLKILRIYGQEIERKEFPVPDIITQIRTLFGSKRAPVQTKADEDLKDVSLHHVIRSEECPFAEDLKTYDKEFKRYIKKNSNAPREMIDKFQKVMTSSLVEDLLRSQLLKNSCLKEVIIEYLKIKFRANVKCMMFKLTVELHACTYYLYDQTGGCRVSPTYLMARSQPRSSEPRLKWTSSC